MIIIYINIAVFGEILIIIIFILFVNIIFPHIFNFLCFFGSFQFNRFFNFMHTFHIFIFIIVLFLFFFYHLFILLIPLLHKDLKLVFNGTKKCIRRNVLEYIWDLTMIFFPDKWLMVRWRGVFIVFVRIGFFFLGSFSWNCIILLIIRWFFREF